tara:strand:- start:6516 stop:6764 length:249 start_codon:yes stop_codon:yes gene_type:complete
MNASKIEFKIYRREFLFEENPNALKEVGIYRICFSDGMQEALNQEQDVTEYIKSINEQWFKDIAVVSLVGDTFNKNLLNEIT